MAKYLLRYGVIFVLALSFASFSYTTYSDESMPIKYAADRELTEVPRIESWSFCYQHRYANSCDLSSQYIVYVFPDGETLVLERQQGDSLAVFDYRQNSAISKAAREIMPYRPPYYHDGRCMDACPEWFEHLELD